MNKVLNNLIHKTITDFFLNQNIESKMESTNLIPLLGGLSAARNFVFEVNNKKYVLRVLPSSNDIETKKHQISLIQNSASIGVGPKIHFVESNFDALVMDYIVGRTAIFSDFDTQDNIRSIANLLKKLHTTKIQFPDAVSPFKRFYTFLNRAQSQKILLPHNFELAIDAMVKIEHAFQKHNIPLVPCHLDLHPLNIMMNKSQFLFIDWANGGLSNPYFDLATFAVFNCSNNQQMQLFLTYYFDRQPTQAELSCFIIAQPVRLLVIAAAYLSMRSNHESCAKENQLSLKEFIQLQIDGQLNLAHHQIGMIMLREGLHMIQSDEFKAALELLK